MKNNKSAFTLIELLVVIAIIAILAAILFPVFAQAKLAAKKTNDLSQNKQLSLASLMYSNDYDDAAMSVPYMGTWSTSCPGCSAATTLATLGDASMGPWWTDRLMPYVKSKGMFANPVDMDTDYQDKGYQIPGLDLADSLTAYADGASTPTSITSQEYRVTYTYNEFVSHGDNNPLTPGAAILTSIPQPANTVLLGPSDNWFNRSSCQNNGTTTSVDYDWDISQGGFGYELWGATADGSDPNLAGFNAGANFAYVDGHAKYAKLAIGADKGIGTDGTAPNAIGYVAYFPQAKTNPNFTGSPVSPGACSLHYDISIDANIYQF